MDKKGMVNVICLSTGTKFDDRYVIRLHNMVWRNLTKTFQFFCFTDHYIDTAGTSIVLLPPPCPLPGYWGKVGLFRLWDDLGIPPEPTLYLDLDSLIVGNLDDFFSFGGDFAIIKHWKKVRKFNKKGEAVQGFNSSAMLWSYPGSREQIWLDFRPGHVERLRGDQDWIKFHSPDEKTFPMEWFQTYEQCGPDGPNGRPRPAPETKIVVCNVSDNHTIEWVPWVGEVWR